MLIDADNWAASGIEVLWFPGGEPHVKSSGFEETTANIWAPIRDWNKWGELLLVIDALAERGIPHNLFLPYLPGARQDRAEHGTALTSQVYANCIEQFTSWERNLWCVDPHSPAAWHIYSQPLIVPLNAFIPDLIPHQKYDVVIAPDKGAVQRAKEVADALHIDDVQYCTKVRDFDTGKLMKFNIPILHPDAKVLIADDICDGGGTFLGISELLQLNTKPDLYVTHGIFSQGFAKLANVFGTIYTTNSWYNPDEMWNARCIPWDGVHEIDLRKYWRV